MGKASCTVGAFAAKGIGPRVQGPGPRAQGPGPRKSLRARALLLLLGPEPWALGPDTND